MGDELELEWKSLISLHSLDGIDAPNLLCLLLFGCIFTLFSHNKDKLMNLSEEITCIEIVGEGEIMNIQFKTFLFLGFCMNLSFIWVKLEILNRIAPNLATGKS